MSFECCCSYWAVLSALLCLKFFLQEFFTNKITYSLQKIKNKIGPLHLKRKRKISVIHYVTMIYLVCPL